MVILFLVIIFLIIVIIRKYIFIFRWYMFLDEWVRLWMTYNYIFGYHGNDAELPDEPICFTSSFNSIFWVKVVQGKCILRFFFINGHLFILPIRIMKYFGFLNILFIKMCSFKKNRFKKYFRLFWKLIEFFDLTEFLYERIINGICFI